jgi:subtilisin family serine protease
MVMVTLIEQLPGLKELWAETLGDPRVCIALLDGPVDRSHPSLVAANITDVELLAPNVVDRASATQHGTHIASVIFGQASGRVPGIAPQCRGISIPIFTTAAGQARLASGQVVPVIVPELRCMYSWTTNALVESVLGKTATGSANEVEQAEYAQRSQGVANFLERIYHELRNLGLTSQERAINYAATNAFNVNNIFKAALRAKMELDAIEVERSPICRPEADCWDVKLLFFDPENVLRSRRSYRFTVDVSDICPVTVGTVRSWSLR